MVWFLRIEFFIQMIYHQRSPKTLDSKFQVNRSNLLDACWNYILWNCPKAKGLFIPHCNSVAVQIQWFSTAAQRNSLHIKVSSLQCCSALVSATDALTLWNDILCNDLIQQSLFIPNNLVIFCSTILCSAILGSHKSCNEFLGYSCLHLFTSSFILLCTMTHVVICTVYFF